MCLHIYTCNDIDTCNHSFGRKMSIQRAVIFLLALSSREKSESDDREKGLTAFAVCHDYERSFQDVVRTDESAFSLSFFLSLAA